MFTELIGSLVQFMYKVKGFMLNLKRIAMNCKKCMPLNVI